MRIVSLFLLTALLSFSHTVSSVAFAADPMSKRESVEAIEKNIAKDKEKVSSKKAEITTAATKLNKDAAQYGNDSSQVRDDRNSIVALRNDLIDLKSDLYKNINKKKVVQGQAIEEEPVT